MIVKEVKIFANFKPCPLELFLPSPVLEFSSHWLKRSITLTAERHSEAARGVITKRCSENMQQTYSRTNTHVEV